jgi:hypothetical protein
MPALTLQTYRNGRLARGCGIVSYWYQQKEHATVADAPVVGSTVAALDGGLAED